MYEIIVSPLKGLYQCAEDGDMTDVAVLAVSSYEIYEEKLKVFGRRLCLKFADITDAADSAAFTDDIAKKIAEYIKGLPQQLDSLFVCCDGGVSRSAAMAAAIMRYNGMDEMKIWNNHCYCPNPLVYKLLCNALGVTTDDKEVADRVKINQQAFSNAIYGKKSKQPTPQ